MYVHLTITPEQLLVISQLLNFTRLGQETMFGNAATDLAIQLGDQENLLDMFEDQFGLPDISFEFSDEEGMVINVL